MLFFEKNNLHFRKTIFLIIQKLHLKKTGLKLFLHFEKKNNTWENVEFCCSNVFLDSVFPPGVILTSWGCLLISRNIFVCHNQVMLLIASGQESEMLPNILYRTVPTTKNHLAQHVNSAKVEKLCSKRIDLMDLDTRWICFYRLSKPWFPSEVF